MGIVKVFYSRPRMHGAEVQIPKVPSWVYSKSKAALPPEEKEKGRYMNIILVRLFSATGAPGPRDLGIARACRSQYGRPSTS
jgi:hypothetical protein